MCTFNPLMTELISSKMSDFHVNAGKFDAHFNLIYFKLHRI